jgi:hypothetical protein
VPSLFTAGVVSSVTERRVARMFLPERAVRVPQGSSACTFVTRVDYETGFERQNPLGAVAAFNAAFTAGRGPRLVIETSHASRYPAEHARLLDAVAGRADISLGTDGGADHSSLLCGSAGERVCFVSLHRSEGTGLLQARAMVGGIPTIVTAHSFGSEMQDHRDSMQIPFDPTAVPDTEYRCEPGGSWAEPDLDEAAKAMRLVAEQPKLALARARRAEERGQRQFAPSRSVRAMKDRLAVIDGMRYEDRPPPAARPGGRRLAVAG